MKGRKTLPASRMGRKVPRRGNFVPFIVPAGMYNKIIFIMV
jgi:hypothetical protein